MSPTSDDRDAVIRDLARLAVELRRARLATRIEPHEQPFPGVHVTVPVASTLVMAGTAHYWLRTDGDLVLAGPISDPAVTAGAVRDWLTGTKARR